MYIPSCVSFQGYFRQILCTFSFLIFTQMVTRCVHSSALALEVFLINYVTNSTNIYGTHLPYNRCLAWLLGMEELLPQSTQSSVRDRWVTVINDLGHRKGRKGKNSSRELPEERGVDAADREGGLAALNVCGASPARGAVG